MLRRVGLEVVGGEHVVAEVLGEPPVGARAAQHRGQLVHVDPRPYRRPLRRELCRALGGEPAVEAPEICVAVAEAVEAAAAPPALVWAALLVLGRPRVDPAPVAPSPPASPRPAPCVWQAEGRSPRAFSTRCEASPRRRRIRRTPPEAPARPPAPSTATRGARAPIDPSAPTAAPAAAEPRSEDGASATPSGAASSASLPNSEGAASRKMKLSSENKSGTSTKKRTQKKA